MHNIKLTKRFDQICGILDFVLQELKCGALRSFLLFMQRDKLAFDQIGKAKFKDSRMGHSVMGYSR